MTFDRKIAQIFFALAFGARERSKSHSDGMLARSQLTHEGVRLAHLRKRADQSQTTRVFNGFSIEKSFRFSPLAPKVLVDVCNVP